MHLRMPGRRALTALAVVGAASLTLAGTAFADWSPGAGGDGGPVTATPIKHLVVIFGENVSFDHYFGTYPQAANPAGEPTFTAAAGTPDVNGLTPALLTHNPNLANPQRLDRSQALTCDQDHGYNAEQKAADGSAMDQFVQDTGHGVTLSNCLAAVGNTAPVTGPSPNFAVMDYFDGNTVTAMWNLAQRFAMSDNAYTTTFGPSTPGALNVTTGQTYGVLCGPSSAAINTAACTATPPATPAGFDNLGTDDSDADPYYDMCSTAPKASGGDGRTVAQTMAMAGTTVGDLLNAKGVTWGWFQGGFDDGYVPGQGTPPTAAQVCAESHQNIGGATVTDYSPHHNPFQYFAQDANPDHLPPTSVAAIGTTDQAKHQYDLADFWAAADRGSMPAVSYLKAPSYQDGHAGYSDPLDEQAFVASTIDRLEKLPSWKSTAVVLTYDDSDGWYDHQNGPVVLQSNTTAASQPIDALNGPGLCGSNPSAIPTTADGQPEQGRCGAGMRIPFLVVSPWAKSNAVSNSVIDQSSVVKFIEDNWGLGSIGNGSADTLAGSITSMFDFDHPNFQPLVLDPSTGQVVAPGREWSQGRSTAAG